MNRYEFNNPIIKKDKKRIQGQTVYPPIMPRSTDLYVTVRDGQRLDTIANEYYGDPSKWWIIAQANNITGGTLFTKPGSQIRIPQEVGKINADLQKLNQER
jgi:nucleoid-associated protein YgaU